MHGYLDNRWREQQADREALVREEAQARARRLESAIGMLAALIGIPALVLAFLGINIRGLTAGTGITLIAGALMGAWPSSPG